MSAELQAYTLAAQAAELNFGGAVRGLLAGHAAAIQRLQDAYVEKDRAFLVALALTQKGVRLDPDGNMIRLIVEGLRGKVLSRVEQELVARTEKQNVPTR